LTVCGVSRIGYGFPERMKGGNAKKEAIGDAIRNAAMRFGIGLEFWHKGDLFEEEAPAEQPSSRIDIIAALINDRVTCFNVSSGKFLSWLKSEHGISSIDAIPADIAPKIESVLRAAPTGKKWPSGYPTV
jgi:hypothetical protein